MNRAALIAVLVVGCTRPGSGDVSPPISSESAPLPADPLAIETPLPEPTIEMLDAGLEPRRALRLMYRVGTTTQIPLLLVLGTTMVIDGVPVAAAFPPTVARSTITITDAGNRRGQALFRLHYRISDYEIALGAGDGDGDDEKLGNRKVPRGYLEQLDELRGLEGASIMNDRGVTLATTVASPTALGEQARSIQAALRELAIALPKQPIGVGGSWRITRQSESGGIRSEIETTYEIAGIEGDVIRLVRSVAQRGQAGPIDGAASPAGAAVTLLELTGAGTGLQTVELSSPRPRQFTFSSQTRSRVKVVSENASQEIDTELRLKLRLLPPR